MCRCCSCNLDGFSALKTRIKHLVGSMRITIQVFSQIVQYADNGKIGMDFAVIVGFPAPVALYTLCKRIKSA